MTGVAAQHAGPSLFISFLISGLLTFITISSLAELSSRISLNGGSGYNYVYVTIGEMAAWIVAVIYILRFLMVGASLSRSLQHYIVGFLKLC